MESDAARERTEKGFERTLERQERELTKDLRKLTRRAYHCEEDALAAAEAFGASLTLHWLTDVSVKEKKRDEKRGRPRPETPFEVTQHLAATPEARASGGGEQTAALDSVHRGHERAPWGSFE